MTIGIIGYGAFGSFVHEISRQYLPKVKVRVNSSKNAVDNVTFFEFEDTACCDIVIPAVPIPAFAETYERIADHARPETVVIDVATVKEYPLMLLRRYGSKFKYVATHPMFGPYSFAKKNRSLDGLKLVVCERTVDSALFEEARKFMHDIGLTILEATAEDHDRTIAETLFLTHLIGQIVTVGGFRRSQIDTVSFGFLMDAVESVQNDTALFRDVYAHNSYCKRVLDRLMKADEEVRRGLQEGA